MEKFKLLCFHQMNFIGNLKSMTQKEILLQVLKDNNEWTPSYEIIKVDTKYGWLGTSADRQARAMAEEGTLERKRDGQYTYYRIKPQENRLFEVPEIVSKKDLMKYR